MAPISGGFLYYNVRTWIGVMGRAKHLTVYWYGAVAIAGLGFGLLGERRPFGEDILAHPVVIYFLAIAVGLLAVRVIWRRPVPEIIPESTLIRGCAAGIALFLVGNFIAAHLIGR
jgi:hypothetical protein